MKKIWIAVLCLPALAFAEPEWREFPYAGLYRVFNQQTLDEAKYVRIDRGFTIRDEVLALGDLRVIIMAADGPIELAIAEDGTVDFPLSDALYAENPAIRTNAPTGVLGARINIVSEAPPQQRFDYALVSEMADEYRELVRKQGMVARLAMPRPKGLRAEFDGDEPAYATIGGERIEADGQGALVIPLRRDWQRAQPPVELSRMPSRLMLEL